jgi:MFS superfamily sulfate permease-like transporter
LRQGFLADFLSRTVLVGFLSGVGVQVALGELHGMLGIEKGGHGFIQQMAFTFAHLSETHQATLFIALAVLGVIAGSKVVAPHFPGALLAVIGMTAASAYFHWGDHGVKIVGDVPGGLPHLGLPEITWSDIKLILPISLSCFIVILAQSAATSRAYALQYRDDFNQNVDLVGLSLANVAAACSSTFVVNGSPTKTAIVDANGGRSQRAHLTTVVVVLLVLLFLTKPLSFLPNAVLSAIVFMVGVSLVDHRGLADLYRRAPREFLVALVTAATVVFIGVEQGIILAVILSLLQHVRRSYRPRAGVIVRDVVDQWRMEETEPVQMIEPGLIMFWFGSDLYYANAGFFAEHARKVVHEAPTPVRWFVIDCGAITGIDYSAGRAVADLKEDLAKAGIVLALARVQLRHHSDLEQLGLIQLIGKNRLFPSRHECLEAYLSEVEGKTAKP